LNKKISLNETLNLIKKDSRRYAKRQSTWFRNSFSYDLIYNKIYTGDIKFTNKAVKALNLLYT
jgi:tRNA delta(2)-isopentenylpyrophosphate transferase